MVFWRQLAPGPVARCEQTPGTVNGEGINFLDGNLNGTTPGPVTGGGPSPETTGGGAPRVIRPADKGSNSHQRRRRTAMANGIGKVKYSSFKKKIVSRASAEQTSMRRRFQLIAKTSTVSGMVGRIAISFTWFGCFSAMFPHLGSMDGAHHIKEDID